MWTSLSEEIEEEFSELSTKVDWKERKGFGFIDGPIVAAARRAMGNNRAEAVLRTKLWRMKQRKDPVLRAAFLARSANNKREWLKRNGSSPEWREKRLNIRRRYLEKIYADPVLHANMLARIRAKNASKPKKPGGRVLVGGRTKRVLEHIGDGAVTSADIQKKHAIGAEWASQILGRLTKRGILVRISIGVYRRK